MFFEKTSTQNYFSALHRKMEEEVENMSNATISSCDFHEWVEYLSNKYYIPPILIFETNVEPNLIETPVKKANPFHHFPYEPEYYEAKRLLKFLDYFLTCQTEYIPNNSILREFVGGGCFKV